MSAEPGSMAWIPLKLLGVAGLVLLNGFFVAAEFALVKVRDTQLEPLIKQGRRRARVARRVLARLDTSLSAAQLGITFTSLGLGWVGEPVFAALLAPLMQALRVESPELQKSIAFAVGFTAITFLHITAGEQAPKWLAIQKPLPATLWVAIPLDLFQKATRPFIWVLNQSSLWLLRRMGIQAGAHAELSHSHDEIRLLVAGAWDQDRTVSLGREIVMNAMDLPHRVAREVMRPRKEVVGLDTTASIKECLEIAEKSRFSRFPLCQGGDLDKTLGVVHIKDLYSLRDKARTGADLLPVVRRLVCVPETARLEALLKRLLERKLHVAIVVDEYGGTLGMLTLENILEQLVGQIQDEFDQEKPLWNRVSDTAWSLDGAMALHDLESLVHEPVAGGEETTVSGWVTRRLGGFPKAGDCVALGAFELCVEEMDGMRVARLSLKAIPEPPPGEPPG